MQLVEPHGATLPAPAAPRRHRVLTHGLSLVLVVGVYVLIAVGGAVTSLGVGMAVPDWPGTFGYNMFLAPLDIWFGTVGVFWEHTHRLIGAAVGLVTLILTGVLWAREYHRPWLRWLGVTLLGAVVVQGLMGGFRVTENAVLLAAVHGVLGQLILVGTIVLATATGREWHAATVRDGTHPFVPPRYGSLLALAGLLLVGVVASAVVGGQNHAERLRTWAWVEVGGIWTLVMALFMGIALARLAQALRGSARRRRAAAGATRSWVGPQRVAGILLALLVVQLALGAAVRHTGAAQAIPDAPLVFGRLLPPSTPEQLSVAVAALPPGLSAPAPATTVGDVFLQYVHRVLALAVLAVLAVLVVSLFRTYPLWRTVRPTLAVVLVLVLGQVMLGIMTVWTGSYPSMATAHQAVGAALLACTTWLTVRIYLAGRTATAPPG